MWMLKKGGEDKIGYFGKQIIEQFSGYAQE
jgi:hypothetical protein